MSEQNSNSGVEIPETVVLEHPFFAAVDGACFFRNEHTGEAVMRLPLDGATAELPFRGIKSELKMADGSPDLLVLDTIEKALNFVPAIRIGDAFPSELHSGQASWDISDKHRALARARISMQLVSWLSGDEAVMHDGAQLEMIAEDPSMKAKISEAFGEAAQKLGMRADQKEEVVNLVDGLAEELSYIEALQNQFQFISVVEARLEELSIIYRSERGIMESLTQASRLCAIPMKNFRERFEELDAQTGEIIAALKNMAIQVKFIRDFRDDMYQRFWAWMPLAKKWTERPARRSAESEIMILETYQFLAQRFLPQNEWELFSQARDNAAKKESETVW